MKIALIGADGQLGTDIYDHFKKNGLGITGLTQEDIEVCDKNSCNGVLLRLKPDLVINTAAYNLVDASEDQISTAFDVNAAGVRNLAETCLEIDAAMMHFSTDFVFGGYEKNSPFTEEDCPSPVSIYGISKLAGELVLKYMLKKYYIIRISGLYGHAGSLGKGYNFVELMLEMAKNDKKIEVVDDQVLTPTSSSDVTEKLFELIQTEKYGTYHMTNTGSCSWFEFARDIFDLSGVKPDLQPISSEKFASWAKRPSYSVLDNTNLRNIGIKDMRHWKEALSDYIRQRREFGKD